MAENPALERAKELHTNIGHALELGDWDGVAALAGRLNLVANTQRERSNTKP